VAKKLFLDPYAFSDPESARDLYSNAIRKSLGYGVPFLEGNNYVAKVISPPLPLKPGDAAIFNNPETLLRGAPVGKETPPAHRSVPPGTLSKFVFYGRIEKIHAPFLEEPCPIAYAVDAAQSYNLIMQHTQFHSLATTTELPAVGDLVNVRLNKGDHGWDLQYGHFVGIYERSTDTIVSSHLPASAKAAIKESAGSPPQDPLQGAVGNSTGAGDYPAEDSQKVFYPGKNNRPGGLPSTNELLDNYWLWIERLLPAGSVATSGVRTQAKQDSLIKGFFTDHWKAGRVAGSPGSPPVGPPLPPENWTKEQITAAHSAVTLSRKKGGPGKTVGRTVTTSGGGHGAGKALDISHPRIPPDPTAAKKRGLMNMDAMKTIQAIVEAASANPDMKVQTKPFLNTPEWHAKWGYPNHAPKASKKSSEGYISWKSLFEANNNCVHVEIISAEPFDEVSFERGRVAIIAQLWGDSTSTSTG